MKKIVSYLIPAELADALNWKCSPNCPPRPSSWIPALALPGFSSLHPSEMLHSICSGCRLSCRWNCEEQRDMARAQVQLRLRLIQRGTAVIPPWVPHQLRPSAGVSSHCPLQELTGLAVIRTRSPKSLQICFACTSFLPILLNGDSNDSASLPGCLCINVLVQLRAVHFLHG